VTDDAQTKPNIRQGTFGILIRSGVLIPTDSRFVSVSLSGSAVKAPVNLN
jgi:hypothetical protein